MKLLLRDLNLGPYLPHPTNTYTCGITITPTTASTIASRVCGGFDS